MTRSAKSQVTIGQAMIFVAAAGFLLWLPARNARRDLRLRDGFLIVSVFWIFLGLAVATRTFKTFEGLAAGGLTKVHNQAVSGVSCAEIGLQLGVPEMLRANEPEGSATAIPAGNPPTRTRSTDRRDPSMRKSSPLSGIVVQR